MTVAPENYLRACGWAECWPGRWRDPIDPYGWPYEQPTLEDAVTIQLERDRARRAFVDANDN